MTSLLRFARPGALGLLPLLAGCDVTWHLGPEGADITMALGSIVSILAVVLYARYRRSGEPSALKRTATFFAGLPFTFFVMLMVEEDPEAVFRRLDGDDEAYDLARLERELAAFREYKASVEGELLPRAPVSPTGLATESPRPEPPPPPSG